MLSLLMLTVLFSSIELNAAVPSSIFYVFDEGSRRHIAAFLWTSPAISRIIE